MTKEKTQRKEFLEAVSVLQWVLSFLLLGKIPLHLTFITFHEVFQKTFAIVLLCIL